MLAKSTMKWIRDTFSFSIFSLTVMFYYLYGFFFAGNAKFYTLSRKSLLLLVTRERMSVLRNKHFFLSWRTSPIECILFLRLRNQRLDIYVIEYLFCDLALFCPRCVPGSGEFLHQFTSSHVSIVTLYSHSWFLSSFFPFQNRQYLVNVKKKKKITKSFQKRKLYFSSLTKRPLKITDAEFETNHENQR